MLFFAKSIVLLLDHQALTPTVMVEQCKSIVLSINASGLQLSDSMDSDDDHFYAKQEFAFADVG